MSRLQRIGGCRADRLRQTNGPGALMRLARVWLASAALLLVTAGVGCSAARSSPEERGYRITHITHVSTESFGLVVIGLAKERSKADQLAREASKALGLLIPVYEYVPGFGFSDRRHACTETGYPCLPPARYEMQPSAFISVEGAGQFESLASTKSYVVIAAHGLPGSTLLSETLSKAQAKFPAAYIVETRIVSIEVVTTRDHRRSP